MTEHTNTKTAALLFPDMIRDDSSDFCAGLPAWPQIVLLPGTGERLTVDSSINQGSVNVFCKGVIVIFRICGSHTVSIT